MDLWERYNKDSKVINNFYSQMNEKNHIEILNKIYDYIKSVTNFYYVKSKIKNQYKFLRKDLLFAERKINDIRLINPNIILVQRQNDSFIDLIVLKTRNFLLFEHGFKDSYSEFRKLNLSNDCHKAANYIKKICDKNHIECGILPIYPGYDEDAMLYNGNGYHFANIVKYNNKYYLVDTTYSQFFYTVRNNLNRLGILNTGGCYPGVFMLMTNDGIKIAESLITNGYIELNDEIFKIYLDAFTISFRNGLYYEETNDFSYTTNYTADDYKRFLTGEDNQINHEGRLYLGYQSRPIKNPTLSFEKR